MIAIRLSVSSCCCVSPKWALCPLRNNSINILVRRSTKVERFQQILECGSGPGGRASTNVCSCNSANGARTEEGAAPHYEYLCSACSKKFSIVLNLAEHEKGQVKCPKCGSTKVDSSGPHSTRPHLRRAELRDAPRALRQFGFFRACWF